MSSAALAQLSERVNSFLLDPQHKDFLTIVKAARNGAVYGAKVRFPHALVMVFLFRSGSLRSKLDLILKATRQHARNLAFFATTYKTVLLILRRLSTSTTSRAGKNLPWHSFVAGLVGGYAVFGRGIQSSVNQQIVIYVFGRVVLGLAKMAFRSRPGGTAEGIGGTGGGKPAAISRASWPAFAALSWAFVMWIFHTEPDDLQPSLRSSMKYIYVNSDTWTGFKDFLIHNT